MLQRTSAYALALLVLAALPAGYAEARPERHAAMIIDANTGAILHNDDGDAIRHPASLTKMMTLYLTFETLQSGRLKLSDKVPISEHAASVAPSKLDLDPGDEITVSDAIKAVITKSANDIAVALAEKIGGTDENFVRLMNTRAREIGMSKTHFENPSGLPNDEHVSTAHDMITLALHLQDDFPTYYPLFSTHEFHYRGKTYRNHNTMLDSFAGTDGIKTGYTRASGFNIVTSVRRGRRHVIGAVFGGSTAARRNREMAVLLTRALTRASTRVTRKPQARPQLIATLTLQPRAAVRPARRPSPAIVATRAEPPATNVSRVSGQHASAAASSSTAGDADLPADAGPALRAMALSQPGDASETPVKIFKVKQVPMVMRAASADETTDMEDTDAPPSAAALSNATGAPTTGAPDLAARLSRSFAASRADPPDPAPEMTATVARQPSTLSDQMAMLGASNQAPPAPVSSPASAARSEPLQRGLPPSTLGAQARALHGASAPPQQAETTIQAAAGRYVVQIGAFGSIGEARQALTKVQDRAGALLAGVLAATPPLNKNGHQIYRARFTGFDANRASSTCTELRRKSIDCFVVAGD